MERMRLTDIQLPYLDTFAKAAELGQFTAAAEHLHLTQAAVSQRIHALEKVLGVALFQRQGGRVFLTEQGQKLQAYAERILDLHREAWREMTGTKTPIVGELLVAASTIPGEHLLPDLVAAFRAQYPDIQVRGSQMDSMGVLDLVEQGKVHLGLVGRKSDSPHLALEPLAADELIVVVAPHHPSMRRNRVTLKQLCSQPLVIREPGSGSRWCLERALSERGKSLRELNIVLELGSNEAIKEAVCKGLGAAVLSGLAVRKELDAGQLHGFKIKELNLSRTIFVAWDKRRALPASARLFRQFLGLVGQSDTG
jgi:DNA-binding transcriptional LysR family regulator